MKKAQLGNIFSLTVAAISLAFIIFVFYPGVFAIKLLVGSPDIVTNVSFPTPENDLLLKTITFQEKEMLVYDAYATIEKDKIEVLEEALKKFVTNKNPCLGLANGDFLNPTNVAGYGEYDDIFIRLKEDGTFDTLRIGRIHQAFIPLNRHNLLKQISFKNKEGETTYVEYYLGECVNE